MCVSALEGAGVPFFVLNRGWVNVCVYVWERESVWRDGGQIYFASTIVSNSHLRRKVLQ